MSINSFGIAGFGIGAKFGTPVSVASASSTTVNITGAAFINTQYLFSVAPPPIAADQVLISLQAVSTSNLVTQTFVISTGAGATFWNDNTSFRAVNLSSVSVNICLISA